MLFRAVSYEKLCLHLFVWYPLSLDTGNMYYASKIKHVHHSMCVKNIRQIRLRTKTQTRNLLKNLELCSILFKRILK